MFWLDMFMILILPLQLGVLLVMDLVQLDHMRLKLSLPKDKGRTVHS
jgi:hypothetical protein